MRTPTLTLVALALLLAACAGRSPGGPETSGTPPEGAVPRCDEIEPIAAPEEAYAREPVYVANEMPVEEVRAWAATRPGFEEIWIDRERNGWVTVAFSSDAVARQAELDERFPDVGVVAVEVDRTLAELEDLQARVTEELSPHFAVSSWISVRHGVVGIALGVLEPERVALVEERFGDEPVCVEGVDPSEAPEPGPQAQAGDGWRLLAARQDVGQPFRTGIATDAESYRALWGEVGLADHPPEVDFESEVAIWFGAVYGSGCDALRLDDVVVATERRLVHADIVLVDPPSACNADANPYAFVVALERERLPEGPFAIQLGADDPPAGAPEERTEVLVDLSQPGAVAGPDDLRVAHEPAEPPALESGAVIEPGFPATYRLWVHCGIEWLGELNGITWRTDVPPGSTDHVPPEWQPAVDEKQSILLEVVLTEGPSPTLTATAIGHTVEYRPAEADPPGCD